MLRPKAPVSLCDPSWGDLGRAELSAGDPLLCPHVSSAHRRFIPDSLPVCPVVFNAGVGGQPQPLPGSVDGGRSSPSFLCHIPSSSTLGHTGPRARPLLLRSSSPCEGLWRVTQFAGTGSTVVAAPSPAGAAISPPSPRGLWRGMQPAALGSGAEQISQLFPLPRVTLPLGAACCLLTAVPLSILHCTEKGDAGAPFPTHLQSPSYSPAPLRHPRQSNPGSPALGCGSFGNGLCRGVREMSPPCPLPPLLPQCWQGAGG